MVVSGIGMGALRGNVVHRAEAPRHHRVALGHPGNAGAQLDHPAHAFVTVGRRAGGVAAVPVGVQIPRADAAGDAAHLYLTGTRVGHRHLHQAHPAAGLILDTPCRHGTDRRTPARCCSTRSFPVAPTFTLASAITHGDH